MGNDTTRTGFRLCVLAISAGLSACGLMAPPLPAKATTALEEGAIERLRVVTQDKAGIRLGAVRMTPGPGLYEGPSEPEEIQGMTQALRAARSEDVIVSGDQPSGLAIGAVYLVRLRCGGVIYVFQDGPQRFAVGDAVLADHSPSFGARPLMRGPPR